MSLFAAVDKMNIDWGLVIFLLFNFLVYRFIMYYVFVNREMHSGFIGPKVKVLLDIFGFILFILFFISIFFIFDGFFMHNIGHISIGFSGFAAFGTVLMAFLTWRIIIQNKEERQESRKPFCVLVSSSDLSIRQDWIFRKSMTVPGVPVTYESPIMNCIKIKNIGTGPALDIKVEIRPGDKEDKNNPQFNVTPIAPGELPYEIDLGNLPANYFKRYYVVYIKYKDIFGNAFEGIYPGKHEELLTLDENMKPVGPVGMKLNIIYQQRIK